MASLAVAVTLSMAAAPALAADPNVPPSVTATVSNANAYEPQTIVASATFTDPEFATETYTCLIDYGDGGLFDTGVVSGNTCTGPAHQYKVTGSYVVMVFVTDSGGAQAVGMAGVHYTNYAPTTPAPGLFGTAPEVGRTVYIAEPFLDSGSSYETYTCTVDYGDGAGSQVGTIVMVWNYNGLPACLGPDHVYQQPGTYTIGAVVTDSGYASTSATGTTTITAPLSPMVAAPPDKTVTSLEAAQYNGLYPYTLGSFTDPGGASAGPWHWTVDWGDGTSGGGTATTQGSVTAIYHYLPGTHRGHLVVTNAAGKSGDAYFNVTVAGDLVVGLNDPSQTATEGVPTTINLYFYDPYPPNSSAPFTIHLNFGDGTGQDISTSSTALPIPFTHTYAAADSTPPGAPGTLYTATATVTDAQGRTGTTTLQIGVYDVAPVVTPSHVVLPPGFNGQITLASFTDASVGPWMVLIDGGPGLQLQQQVATPGPIQIAYPASAGSRTFTVSVWDRAGLHTTVTSDVVVQHSSPLITDAHFTPSPNIEGSPVSVVATFSAPGLSSNPPETFACFVDYGDGSGQKIGTVTGNQCFGPGHLYSGLGPYTATVSVIDSVDGVGMATVSITLPNDPPVVGPVSLPYAFEVGVPVTAHATFSDRGLGVTSETYTCTVDYGDGSGPQPGSIVGTECYGPSHTYSQDGDYDVTVRVTDSNGGVGSHSISIGLSNIGPTITDLSFNPGPSLLGTPVALVATFTDPGFGVTPETYSCYVAYGDSTGAQPGTIVGNQCIGPQHVYTSGLGPFSLEVFLYDSNGGSDWATTDITLLNIAPVVSAYGIVSFGQTGSDEQASVIFADPGPVSETHTCTIDYGDGGGPQAGTIAGNICTGPHHTYATKGTYLFSATVADSLGAVGAYSLEVVMYNPWPVVGAVSAPASAKVGTPVTASAPYVSTGLEPADTCTVDYGDGTGPQAATTDGTTCTGPSHVYSNAGAFQITVTVTSTQGVSRSSTAAVAVTPLFVVGPVAIPATINEGSSVSASATFSPVGTQTYKCTINYGDGSANVAGTVTGTTCKGPSHKFGRAGVFTVTVSVTGSKGASGSSSATLGVINVGPGSIVGAVTQPIVKLGSASTVSVSFTDPGTSESYTVVVTWGDGSQSSTSLGSAARQVSVTHVYARAGRYGVTVGVSDGQGMNVVPAATIPGWPGGISFVVYDPARTVTGSGTVSSPAGACQLTRACGVASMAGFSVTASYARGATRPTVSFSYSATGFSFTATGVDYMVAAGGTVTIHGTGKVNGASGYSFELVMVDGKTDSMQLIVCNSSYTVYQNGNGQSLKTGGVTIK